MEGFTLDIIENIHGIKCILSLDESDVNNSEYPLDEEGFENGSNENINIGAGVFSW